MNYYLQNISNVKGYRLIRKGSQKKERNYMKKGGIENHRVLGTTQEGRITDSSAESKILHYR